MKPFFTVDCEICGGPCSSFEDNWLYSYVHKDQSVCLRNLEYKRIQMKREKKIQEQENGSGI